jgi:oxygen-dependent protoporphyrinogen oxidase
MATLKVAVVGAGIAGLGAAWRLARRGFEVSVLECESRPEGWVRQLSRDGFAIEAFGAMIGTADRALLTWIGELGFNELLPLRPVVSTLVQRNQVHVIDARSLYRIARTPGIRVDEALRLIRLPRLASRYGDRIDPERPELAASLDDRSVADFGELYFGRSVVERWMSPMLAHNALVDAREASRVLFLHRYRRGANARLGLLRVPSIELAEKVTAALSTQLGVRATRIESRPGGGVRVVVRDRDRERREDADAVVVATSASEAATLAGLELSLAERDAFAKVRYTPALSLAIALRRPFYAHPQYIQFPRSEESPLDAALLESGVAGGRIPEGRGLATLHATGAWSQAHFEAPDDAVRKELSDAFGRVVPRIHGAELFSEILRDPRAAPRFDVGRYRDIADFTRIQLDRRQQGRRIYFAGDYLMGPGWDAALRSGQRAASAVEEDLGSTPRSPGR